MLLATQCEALAKEIYDWCVTHELWGDNCMYFNDKAWAAWDEWHGEYGIKIDENLYEYQNKNPRDYFEYTRDPNYFSMSFEGPLYDVLNSNVVGWVNLYDEFMNIFEKYNVYAEFGHAWNLSVYDL